MIVFLTSSTDAFSGRFTVFEIALSVYFWNSACIFICCSIGMLWAVTKISFILPGSFVCLIVPFSAISNSVFFVSLNFLAIFLKRALNSVIVL